jgi:flagellar basal body-associated protein FliL
MKNKRMIWILQIIILSILLISSFHYFYHCFKNKFIIPKNINLTKEYRKKYKKIYQIIDKCLDNEKTINFEKEIDREREKEIEMEREKEMKREVVERKEFKYDENKLMNQLEQLQKERREITNSVIQ